MSTRFRTTVAMVGLIAFAALGPILLSPQPAIALTATVTVDQPNYDPNSVQIRPGSTVKWVCGNPNGEPHNVTFDNGITFNQDLCGANPSSTSYTFGSTQRTYDYHCSFYPQTMKGKVIVTNNPTPTQTGTGTITHTVTESPRPKKSSTSSHSPTASASATPTPTPTPTLTPTPTPTPTPEATVSGIGGTQAGGEQKTSSNGNAQAIGAIIGVLALGVLGFLIYKKTIGRSAPPPAPPPDMEP